MANITRRLSERTELPTVALWDPFRLLMNDVFGSELFGGMSVGGERTFTPHLDVKETRDDFCIRADVPGLNESEVQIDIDGSRLTLSGQREAEERTEDERYYAYERNYGAFTRSFVMPDTADMEHVQADLRNGVLTVHVPKKAETKSKRVPIGTAKVLEEKVVAHETKAEAKKEAKAA
jgi:HSP20 family protein